MARRARAELNSPPLVLLHGLGTGPGAWRPQVEAFGSSTRVLTPRLSLDERFTVEAEAARIRNALEPDVSVDVCGLSLGALVALRMALDDPSRVHRLALCAGFAALPWPLALLQAVLGASTALVPSRVLREQLVASVPKPEREIARRETAWLERRGLRAAFREGRRFDVRHELDRLTMPVLVLVGERDRANRRLSRALAERLGGELCIVRGAGHLVNLDAPEAFNQALRSFLDA